MDEGEISRGSALETSNYAGDGVGTDEPKPIRAQRLARAYRKAAYAFNALADALEAYVASDEDEACAANSTRFDAKLRAEIVEEIATIIVALLQSEGPDLSLDSETGGKMIAEASTTKLFEACQFASREFGIAFRFRHAQQFGKWIPHAIETIASLGVSIVQGRDRDKKKTWTIVRSGEPAPAPAGSPGPAPAANAASRNGTLEHDDDHEPEVFDRSVEDLF